LLDANLCARGTKGARYWAKQREKCERTERYGGSVKPRFTFSGRVPLYWPRRVRTGAV